MARDKQVRTSESRTALSLMPSLWAPKPFLLVATRDTASDEGAVSRSLEGRNSLTPFPFSIEVLGGWLSEPADPEAAPDPAVSNDRRDRDWDDGSIDWASRFSLLSDLEKDLLRCGLGEGFKELSMTS